MLKLKVKVEGYFWIEIKIREVIFLVLEEYSLILNYERRV